MGMQPKAVFAGVIVLLLNTNNKGLTNVII
jgi:hypothetical protein